MDPLSLDDGRLKACKEKIEGAIRDIVVEGKASGVVVGLSGGVDSSLVLALAASSGADVYALIMPEEAVTPKKDVSDAVALAKAHGIRHSVIKIDPVLSALEKAFPWGSADEGDRKVSFGNAKARVRMTMSYLAANLEKRIVLGTGNKTEIMLGYSTKHGDGGVDIQPIGGLYKTQVRQLARYVGIPEEIVGKVPTAGLWRGQTDEGEIGASYADIDLILQCLVDEGMGERETAKKLSKDPGLVEKISGMVEKNMHKRTMPKIVPLFDQLQG